MILVSGYGTRWYRRVGVGIALALLFQFTLVLGALFPVGQKALSVLAVRPAWACGLAGGPTMLADDNAAIPNPQVQDLSNLAIAPGVFAYDFLVRKPISFTEDLSRVPSAPNKNLLKWQWDFGDGAQAIGPIVKHMYSRPGTFTVLVRIYEEIGKKWDPFDGSQVTVMGHAFPQPPLAVPLADQTEIELGQAITLDATKSSANRGMLTRFDWNFGDGQVGQGAKVTHSFSLLGRSTVVLIVTDSRGARGIGSVVITIGPRRPVMVVSATPARIVPGGTVHFDASASHVAEIDNHIVTYRWDFGDGSVAQFTDTPQISHRYPKTGTYTVIVRGVDLQNAVGTARLQLQVRVFTPQLGGLFSLPYLLASLGLLVLLVGGSAWYYKQRTGRSF